MDNYKTRPKINSKIIFHHLLPNTKKILIIGNNNLDIIEILKQKKINFLERQNTKENDIIEYLNFIHYKEFDAIILNLELCNYHRIDKILNLLIEKSKYSIIRFRNHNIETSKVSKKQRINTLIYKYKINVFKKFYGKENYVCKNILFSKIAYYTVYFIMKDEIELNYEIPITERIKNFFLSFKREAIRLIINRKNYYGKK